MATDTLCFSLASRASASRDWRGPFEQRLRAAPHLCLRYSCSPYHQDSALYPIIAELERATGFERDDIPETRLDKLEALVAASSLPEEDTPLLADMLSLTDRDRYPCFDLAPQRKKERTFAALLRRLAGSARQQPVLIVFEDLRWIDPTSCDLLDLIIERLVKLLAGGEATLPSRAVDEIVERCDGMPLFLEELTKAVLEDTAGQFRTPVSAVTRTVLRVPVTLQASLLTRVDRLGPTAKEVAQIGATIRGGIPVPAGCRSRLARRSRAAKGTRPACRGGSPYPAGLAPDASFLFKHALVQAAVYDTLLRGPLEVLLSRIVDTLLLTGGEKPAAAPKSLPVICKVPAALWRLSPIGVRPANRRRVAPPTAKRSRISAARCC